MPKQIIDALTGRTIRCILFDLGGTLWTGEKSTTLHMVETIANERAVALLHQHVPEQLPCSLDPVALGIQLRKVVDEQVHAKTRQHPGHEPDFAQTAIDGLQQLGILGIDQALGAAIFEALRVQSYGSRILFPDTLSTLAALRERGFLLGVVTNRRYGSGPFQQDLQAFGLLDYFDPRHIAVSADLGVRKPNSALFQHTLDSFGIPPQEAVMVGDSLRADVGGANQLDIFAVWKPKLHLRAKAKVVLPPDKDGQYLITYVQRLEAKKKHHVHYEAKPDLIIHHLRDLLTVFTEAGSF